MKQESLSLYNSLFEKYPQHFFIVHQPFDKFIMDVNAAPFDDFQNRTLIIDSTGQKIKRNPNSPPE